MKNKIVMTLPARNDLEQIFSYIAEELESPQAAEKTIDRIIDTTAKLEDFGEMGMPIRGMGGHFTAYRYLISGSYMIFYRKINNDIIILRVLYGKRDYNKLFSFIHEDLDESIN